MPLKSVIPHLARAIAENHNSKAWRPERQQRIVLQVRFQSLNRTRSSPKPPLSPPARKTVQLEKNWPAQLTSTEDPVQARRISVYFKITATFACVVGIYCTFLYVNWTKAVTNHANSDNHLPFNADVSSRWKELGRDFDDEVEMSEKLMLMKKKRKRLVHNAYGNVLEVSVGTGRNLEYYDLRDFNPTNSSPRNIITHLTLNDQSGVIIAAAERKLEKIMSRQEKLPTAKIDFVIGDAGVSGVIERPAGGYDTIVQTMGVCSMVDPVGFLRKMGQLCRQPGEQSKTPANWRTKDDDGKGGQILLLEHGRGYFDWLNWVLDSGASLHAHRFGCWWNKDIEQIIKQSGLEIEQIKRYHGGTTWMIVLRPKAQRSSAQEDLQAENLQHQQKRQFGFSSRR